MHQNNFQIIQLCSTQVNKAVAAVQCERKIEKCVKRVKFKVTDNDENEMSNKYKKQSENSCKRQFML